MPALTLYDHLALQPLLAPLKRYILKELGVSADRDASPTSQEEHIAAVFDRVGELQNCIESMRLALFSVIDLSAAEAGSWRQYQYHYENFLLRLTGVADRAYRMVGTVLRLEPTKFEKLGGNAIVEQAIPRSEESLAVALRQLTEVVHTRKSVRNAVAHSNAFTTRELSLFATIEQINVQDVDMDHVRQLMTDHYAAGAEQLAFLLSSVVRSVQELLAALAPLLEALSSSTTTTQQETRLP